MQCPSCGRANQTGVTFCGGCGNRLSPADVPTAAAPTPPTTSAPTFPPANAPTFPPPIPFGGSSPTSFTPAAPPANPAPFPGTPAPAPAYPTMPSPAAAPAPAAAQLVLVCMSGPDVGKRLLLTENEVVIGSASNSGLMSGDPEVAPHHVGFYLRNNVIYFRSFTDAGIFVNGVQQKEGALPPGFQLRIARSFWQIELPQAAGARPHGTGANPSLMDHVTSQISAVTGVDKLEGLNTRELFSTVLEKHTEDEVEDYFLVGTPTTTPAITAVNATWPKPWLFFKALTIALAVYFAFVFGWNQFKNLNLVPGLIIVGSFAFPLAAVLFYFEMNVPRNVSLYQVMKMILVGGIISLIVSLFGFQFAGSLIPKLGASVAGLIEEPGKLAALLIIANNPRFRWTLNGLLFGGAVGAGFAGFESAGYALNTMLKSGTVDEMLSNITLRGLLAPGGHVAWAALYGAALWKVKGDRPFTPSMLMETAFLRVFAFSVVLHMLWNSDFQLPYFGKYILLIVLAWLTIFSFVQDGIKQVQKAQTQS